MKITRKIARKNTDLLLFLCKNISWKIRREMPHEIQFFIEAYVQEEVERVAHQGLAALFKMYG